MTKFSAGGTFSEPLACSFEQIVWHPHPNHSRNTSNGWLVVDGGGNRPNFDLELSREVDLVIVPFRASEEDIDTVAQSLTAMPSALAWPCAWPTNGFAINAAQYLIDGLGKAFP